MRKLACVAFIVLGYATCYPQGDMTLLSNWKSCPAPVTSDTISKYSSSANNWWVYLKNGTVRAVNKDISPKLPFYVREDDGKNNISFIKVDDGFLVGFYRGEWGGSLHWFSLNGKKRYKISDDEIVQFAKRDGKDYAIQGLAHGGVSEGSIINIKKVKGKWTAKEYLKIPNAPLAITVDNEKNFLIITSKSLFSIDSSATIHTLVNRGMWWNRLYPTSILKLIALLIHGAK